MLLAVQVDDGSCGDEQKEGECLPWEPGHSWGRHLASKRLKQINASDQVKRKAGKNKK